MLTAREALATAQANSHVLENLSDQALVGEMLRRRAQRLAARAIVEAEPRPDEMARELARLTLGADVLERDPLWEM